ncbi:MAG: hypothetical protein WCQ80_01175 [Bacilli bacterium]
MKRPPLRLYFYGIRLFLLITLIFLGLTYTLPMIIPLHPADGFALLIGEVMVLVFGFGFHTFYTTSKTYLSIRSHRERFFMSSERLGLTLSVIGSAIIIGYFFLYNTQPIDTVLITTLIVFPFIFLAIIHSMGVLAALILKNRLMQLVSLAFLTIAITFFYADIWTNRLILQQMLILFPLRFYGLIFYYLLIGGLVFILIVLTGINRLIYIKKR